MSELTTRFFWDCNCDENYIHPKTEPSCAICSVHVDDDCQPDSHVSEVLAMSSMREFLLSLGHGTVFIVFHFSQMPGTAPQINLRMISYSEEKALDYIDLQIRHGYPPGKRDDFSVVEYQIEL